MSEQHRGPYRLVVGFDGSEGSHKALSWAAGEAELRGGDIRAVLAWLPGEFGTDQEQTMIHEKKLHQGVAEVLGSHDGLSVEEVTEQGHATKVLLRHAADADMLVVGSRGHGGFTGLLIGSVSQQVATHNGAPVVVIVRS